jgi:hypothetical protein
MVSDAATGNGEKKLAMRTVVTASAIGTTIEWYDFLIYSTAASLILNKLFFPTNASFAEETRAYFFGREEEVAELARRVQRKLLTVLFGRSGLGIQSGFVDRLCLGSRSGTSKLHASFACSPYRRGADQC